MLRQSKAQSACDFVARLWAEHWQHVLTLGPHAHAHWPALRVGISVSLPLVLAVALGRADLVPYGVFGAINSVYGKQVSYTERARLQAVAGVALTGAVVAGTAVGVVAPGSLLAVVVMSLAALLGYVLSKTHGLIPIPSLFLVFASGTLSSYRHHPGDILLAIAVSMGAATFSLALGQVGRVLPTSHRPRVAAPERLPLGRVLGTRDRQLGVVAHFVGPLAAGTAATMAGIGHPYWAAVTATVPLIGPNLAARLARGSLRFLGTLVGVGVAFLLLAPRPSVWVLVGAVALLQVVTELFVGRNYGIAVVAITPMALILTTLGTDAPVHQLVADRLIETLIGAAVSMVMLLAIHPLRR